MGGSRYLSGKPFIGYGINCKNKQVIGDGGPFSPRLCTLSHIDISTVDLDEGFAKLKGNALKLACYSIGNSS